MNTTKNNILFIIPGHSSRDGVNTYIFYFDGSYQDSCITRDEMYELKKLYPLLNINQGIQLQRNINDIINCIQLPDSHTIPSTDNIPLESIKLFSFIHGSKTCIFCNNMVYILEDNDKCNNIINCVEISYDAIMQLHHSINIIRS